MLLSIPAAVNTLLTLKELSLEKNLIRKIENLTELKKLKVLLLDGNFISKLEGLTNNAKIKDLSCCSQTVAPDTYFTIDEYSIVAMSVHN